MEKTIFEIAKEVSHNYQTGHMILTGFIRCSCDKIHARHGIGHNTVCKCGTNLYRKAWNL